MTVQPTSASAQAPPAAVRTSFTLWVLDAVLGLVGVLTLLPGGQRLVLTGLPEAAPTSEQSYMHLLAEGMVILALTAAELYVAARMRAGHNWARIVLAAFGGLGLVYVAITLNTTIAMLSDGWDGAVMGGTTLISVPLVIAAIAFMYLPAARDHFTGAQSGVIGQERERIILRVAIFALVAAALLWVVPEFLEGVHEGVDESHNPVQGR